MVGNMEIKKTLYERLGGYDAISGVVDDFLGRIIPDNQINRYFVGHGTDSRKKIRQLIVELICNATGGPCNYTGRDIKTAHTGLKINESDWQVAVNHMTATLEKFKVAQKEKAEVLAVVSGLKKDIVGI